MISSLMVLFPSLMMAQALDENPEIRQNIDEMFSELEKSRVSTGFLLDYAIDLVEFSDFDGTQLTDSNYIDFETFELILRGLNSSSVSSNSINVPAFADAFQTPMTSNQMNLGIALYKYQYIKENALKDGLIEYSSGKVYDVYNGEKWVNPYELADIVAFTPSANVCFVGNVRYNISSSFIFKNQNFNNIMFDFGDGNGYRTIIGGHANVNYSTPGEKELKMRVVLNGGKVLEAHSKIIVLENQSVAAHGQGAPDVQEIVTHGGVSARVSMYYASGHTRLYKPFIVVEGFDPWQLNDLFCGNGNLDIELGFTNHIDFYPSWKEEFDHGDEYDLVYVDWYDSFADLKDNAELLIKILKETIKNRKSQYCEQAVLMGQSMGGLISRLALCKMESEKTPHGVETFVSHDTPHLGANVPVGFLYLLHHLACMLSGSSEPKALTDGDLQNMGYLGTMLNYLYSSQSIKQMLVNYVGQDGELCNTVYNDLQSELKQLGFPKGDNGMIQNLSIVNGNIYNYRDYLYNDQYYLKLHGSLKFSWWMKVIVSKVLEIPEVSDILDMIGVDGLANIIKAAGKKKIDIVAVAMPMISHGGVVSRVTLTYTKKRLWKEDEVFYAFYGEGRGVGLPYDTFPGSIYSLGNLSLGLSNKNFDNFGLEGSFQMGLANSFTFIPTASAFAINNESISASYYEIDYYNDPPEPLNDCPLDAYYICDTTVSHIYINNDVYDWLNDQINIKIEGEEWISEQTQYSISGYEGPIAWSVSDTSVAEIDQTGLLTINSGGVLTITAECYNNGALIRRQKKVAVGIPEFAIKYTYELGTGYIFTAYNLNEEDSEFIGKLIESREISFEWGILEDDGTNYDIIWTNSNEPYFTYVPSEVSSTSVYLRVKTEVGMKDETNAVNLNLYSPFEGDYKYIIVNRLHQMYFVKSDICENSLPNYYTLSYVPNSENPLFNSLINGPRDYLRNSDKIYIRFPNDEREVEVNKENGVFRWKFNLFNTPYFYFKVNAFWGGQRPVIDTGFMLYNSDGEIIQRIKLPIIYNADFNI